MALWSQIMEDMISWGQEARVPGLAQAELNCMPLGKSLELYLGLSFLLCKSAVMLRATDPADESREDCADQEGCVAGANLRLSNCVLLSPLLLQVGRGRTLRASKPVSFSLIFQRPENKRSNESVSQALCCLL